MKLFNKISAKAKAASSKMNGDSQLVVVLILIVVAIGLCVIFQKTIRELMGNIFNSISTKINNMMAITDSVESPYTA